MADRIQVRRDTAARWLQYNPILLEGEQGFETDTDQYKMGDGVHTWDELPYRGGPFLQQRGNSTTGAMSQDAVTKEFKKYDASMEELQTEVFPLSATLKRWRFMESDTQGTARNPYSSGSERGRCNGRGRTSSHGKCAAQH